MCGITGLLQLDGRPVDLDLLERMTTALHHRGPDEYGYFREEAIGLGFRRLSIIDLSGGHQPMPNEDGTVQIVFNGEIYNFRDLRVALERLGHVFHTVSDTEVIIHGYEAWGDNVATSISSMSMSCPLPTPRDDGTTPGNSGRCWCLRSGGVKSAAGWRSQHDRSSGRHQPVPR